MPHAHHDYFCSFPLGQLDRQVDRFQAGTDLADLGQIRSCSKVEHFHDIEKHTSKHLESFQHHANLYSFPLGQSDRQVEHFQAGTDLAHLGQIRGCWQHAMHILRPRCCAEMLLPQGATVRLGRRARLSSTAARAKSILPVVVVRARGHGDGPLGICCSCGGGRGCEGARRWAAERRGRRTRGSMTGRCWRARRC